jgi:hypothetical protein
MGVLSTAYGYHTVAAENTRQGYSVQRMAITAWLAYSSSQPLQLKMAENVRAAAAL